MREIARAHARPSKHRILCRGGRKPCFSRFHGRPGNISRVIIAAIGRRVRHLPDAGVAWAPRINLTPRKMEKQNRRARHSCSYSRSYSFKFVFAKTNLNEYDSRKTNTVLINSNILKANSSSSQAAPQDRSGLLNLTPRKMEKQIPPPASVFVFV